MDRLWLLGVALTAVGLLGYVVGVSVDYPGRAFSVTAVMVGLTLFALGNRAQGGRGRASRGDGESDRADERARGGECDAA
jgi:hypothetical protein